MAKKYVLVVEDSMEDNNAIRKLIRSLGAEILCPYTTREPQIAFTTDDGGDHELVLARAVDLLRENSKELHAIILDLAWTASEQTFFEQFEEDGNASESRVRPSPRVEIPRVFRFLKELGEQGLLIPVLTFSRYDIDVGAAYNYFFQGATLCKLLKKGDHYDTLSDLRGPLESAIKFSELIKKHTSVFVPPVDRNIRLLNLLPSLANSDEPILIEGATGTGKEMFAKLIHTLRGKGAFYHVSLGARRGQPDMLRSELFGHEKGAFTGAIGKRIGVLVQASKDNGTVLLDEIGKVNEDGQALLLKLVQNKTAEIVGGDPNFPVRGARLIFAASEDLAKLEAEGKFLPDLRYRIRIHVISLPTIKELQKLGLDIAKFIHWADFKKLKRGEDDDEALADFDFPGNYRQLHNILCRADREGISIRESLSLERVYEHRKESFFRALPQAKGLGDQSVDMNFIADSIVSFMSAIPGKSKDFIDRLETSIARRLVERTSDNRKSAAKVWGIEYGKLNRLLRKKT